MSNLDIHHIIHGSDSKSLIVSYNDLVSNYTSEGADEYLNQYKDKKLSFILENSRYIFSEPKHGFEFYKTIMENRDIGHLALLTEESKIKDYLEETDGKMKSEQKALYESLLSDIQHKINTDKKNIVLESMLSDGAVTDNTKNFYDALYEYENSDDGNMKPLETAMHALTLENAMVHALPVAGNIYPMQALVNSKISYLAEMLESTDDSYASSFYTPSFIASIMESSDHFSSLTNSNLKGRLEAMSEFDINGDINDTYLEKTGEDGIVYLSPEESVASLFNEEFMDEVFKESSTDEKICMLQNKKAVYDTLLEYVSTYNELFDEDLNNTFEENALFDSIKRVYGLKESVTNEEAQELMMKACSDIDDLITEYTNDGSPSQTIKNSHTNFREDPKLKTSNSGSNQSTDDDDDDESSNKSTGVSGSNNTSVYTGSADNSSANTPVNPSVTPQKPKTGIIQKIQNKSLDLHAKTKAAGGKLKQLGTSIKNAGKAVLKIPSGMIDSAKRMVKNFDTMDEEHRKQVMLEPGFRKKWFGRMKSLIMYGGAAYANMMLVPVVWFAKRLSNEKNKRVRNEFVAELDTEIKVCEEKINDANSQGDQQQKYQLMRLKDKLSIERERVIANSKYI